MKILAVLVTALSMTGCASYQTHLTTGCIWSCDQWRDYKPTGVYSPGYGGHAVGPSVTQVILPNAGYMVIRSGNLTTVTQTSKSYK